MATTITRPSTYLKEQAGDLLARLRLGVVDEIVITRYGKPEAVLLRYEENGAESEGQPGRRRPITHDAAGRRPASGLL